MEPTVTPPTNISHPTQNITSPTNKNSQRSHINLPQYTIYSFERNLQNPQTTSGSLDIPPSYEKYQEIPPRDLQNIEPREIHTFRDDNQQEELIINSISQKISIPRWRESDRFEQKELPKTINSVFGSIKDFLNFFVKRNPEIRDFAKQYKEIEDTEDLKRLNTIICPEFAKCIHKESQKSPNPRNEVNPAILFENRFLSFEQFYAQVLRAYTMSSFLYRNLNKYLRNEDWDSFNDLLPYAFGLCRTFFCQHLASDLMKHSQIKTSQSNIILYRGATFDEYALGIYNPETLKNFSWYSVTSTTTNLNIAKRFMEGAKPDPKNPKVPVIFMIEVPLMSLMGHKYLSYIDMKQYSEFSMEDEVILPPGSVFSFQGVQPDKAGFTMIKLNLISDVETLSHEGLIMQGAMQSKMMTETEAKIMCMDGNDLAEALRHVTGNNLIQEIEFCLCKFDGESLRKMADVLPTMNAIKRLKFISCSYEGSSNSLNNLSLKIQKVEIIEFDQNFYKILSQSWSLLLTSLDFGFVDISKITSQEIKALCTDGLQNLPELQSLSLNFTRCLQFTPQDMTNLCSLGLKSLTRLQSLSLNFTECKTLADSSLSILSSQGFLLQFPLTHLILNFQSCELLTDQGISSLSVQNLPNLTSFSLSLAYCSNISDQSLTFQQYPLLTILALDLTSCPHITHKSFESFPTTLISLKLHLASCSQLTDSSIISLSTGLLPLTNLTSLDLSFSRCSQITNQGISRLSSHLQHLTSLSLDLAGCKAISDEGLQDLALNGVKSLTKLTSLSLNLQSCNITNEGLDALSLTALPNLSLLQSLNLNLYWCSHITDESLINLFARGLVNSLSAEHRNIDNSIDFCCLQLRKFQKHVKK